MLVHVHPTRTGLSEHGCWIRQYQSRPRLFPEITQVLHAEPSFVVQRQMGSENQHETCHESRDTGHNCRHEIRYTDLHQFHEKEDMTAEMESSQNKFGAASKTTPPVVTMLQDALTNNISQEKDYVLVFSIGQRTRTCLRQTRCLVGYGATLVTGIKRSSRYRRTHGCCHPVADHQIEDLVEGAK